MRKILDAPGEWHPQSICQTRPAYLVRTRLTTQSEFPLRENAEAIKDGARKSTAVWPASAWIIEAKNSKPINTAANAIRFLNISQTSLGKFRRQPNAGLPREPRYFPELLHLLPQSSLPLRKSDKFIEAFVALDSCYLSKYDLRSLASVLREQRYNWLLGTNRN